MEIIETSIEGLKVIETKSFSGDQGYLTESYNKIYSEIGINNKFIQDN